MPESVKSAALVDNRWHDEEGALLCSRFSTIA
jgi:hypothetical protein